MGLFYKSEERLSYDNDLHASEIMETAWYNTFTRHVEDGRLPKFLTDGGIAGTILSSVVCFTNGLTFTTALPFIFQCFVAGAIAWSALTLIHACVASITAPLWHSIKEAFC